ncbi:endonuclease 4 [Methanofollis liminatans DSM 4140]|uniref:Probable endonuclease 4 n=1 Tax=Methanofollis liminatans DSM 4140 TaxID=28892 RepID=J1L1G2_9EURY|nr:deoxyribonuclease IV [Methanofollis liminatans]EJG06505.1 endonuclease 4 [Methanofollis liminatans DSM 4140]
MIRAGCHVSIAGSLADAVGRAEERGCDCFQIFSRNPRGWRFKDLTDAETDGFKGRLAASGLGPVVDHMPYLPNLASPKEEVYEKSVETLTAELNRCEALGIPFLVMHLGSHLGTGIEVGRERLIDGILQALAAAPGGVRLLLENTAGTKNGLGGTFEEIALLLDALPEERTAVCFDTCHAFAAGYDLRDAAAVGETLDLFDGALGLERLHVVHCNDCKGALGSHLDRHEHIGLGAIGEDGFVALLAVPAIRRLPLICETPVDERRDDTGNIRRLRELAGV